MADINQIVTLGIGTPSSIEHFILDGLNAAGVVAVTVPTKGRLPQRLVPMQKPGISAIDLLKPERWELGPITVTDLRPAVYAVLTLRYASLHTDARLEARARAHARIRTTPGRSTLSTCTYGQAEAIAYDGYREQQAILSRLAALEATNGDEAEALALLGL